jgi:hypothetical protein
MNLTFATPGDNQYYCVLYISTQLIE